MRRLRILHVPNTVGGHPQGLARAERELGHDSHSVALWASAFAYPVDEVLRDEATTRFVFEWRRATLLVRALRWADVIHFNFGSSIVPRVLRNVDLPLLRAAGKVVAVTFQGDDARLGVEVRARGGLSLPSALPERYGADVDAARRAVIRRFARHAHLVYYLNSDLAVGLPERARFVPYAHVDPRQWEPAHRRSLAARPIRILHAPSDRIVKGTRHVEEAVGRLRAEDLKVELVLVENMTHDRARLAYADADIAVDQLYAGWYGGFAVEAMALGLPVIAHIRDEDLPGVPKALHAQLPVIRATPDTLQAVLRDALSPLRREEVAACSRPFVECWHDPRKIARGVLSDYETVFAAPRRSSIRR